MPDGAAVSLTKHVSLQRASRGTTLYWWSLPLRLRDVKLLFGAGLTGARAIVHPASALGHEAAALGAKPWPGDTVCVADIGALLEARDGGQVAPCTIAIFPPAVPDSELAPHLAHFRDDLEQLGFTIAMVPDGDGRARHRFCFRVPGHSIVALEHLAHGRRFADDPARVEAALLDGLRLRPRGVAHLRLVLQNGTVQLIGDKTGARVREAWRRFPLGVVMMIGLPFFIAAFWIHSLMTRRGARVAAAPAAPAGTPSATRVAATPGAARSGPAPRPTASSTIAS